MARKNAVLHRLETAKSMAASFTTAPTIVRYLDNCSYQINITTSNSVGTFSVEGSLDYEVNEANGDVVVHAGNWIALNLSGGTPSAAAANDSILIDLNQLPYNAIRLKYTSSVAGTGVCEILIMCRQLGG